MIQYFRGLPYPPNIDSPASQVAPGGGPARGQVQAAEDNRQGQLCQGTVGEITVVLIEIRPATWPGTVGQTMD